MDEENGCKTRHYKMNCDCERPAVDYKEQNKEQLRQRQSGKQTSNYLQVKDALDRYNSITGGHILLAKKDSNI